MSKQRLGPEAKIINLFAALSDDSKRIVLDVIRSQAATPRKVKAATNKPSTDTRGAKEPTADKEARCIACGNIKASVDHRPDSPFYHEFDSGKPVVADGLCAFKGESGAVCLSPPSNAIHDKSMGYAGYHRFVAAKPTRQPRTKKDPPAVIPIEGQGVDLAAELES